MLPYIFAPGASSLGAVGTQVPACTAVPCWNYQQLLGSPIGVYAYPLTSFPGYTGYAFYNTTGQDLSVEINFSGNCMYINNNPASGGSVPLGAPLSLSIYPVFYNVGVPGATPGNYYVSSNGPPMDYSIAPNTPGGNIQGYANISYKQTVILPGTQSGNPPYSLLSLAFDLSQNSGGYGLRFYNDAYIFAGVTSGLEFTLTVLGSS